MEMNLCFVTVVTFVFTNTATASWTWMTRSGFVVHVRYVVWFFQWTFLCGLFWTSWYFFLNFFLIFYFWTFSWSFFFWTFIFELLFLNFFWNLYFWTFTQVLLFVNFFLYFYFLLNFLYELFLEICTFEKFFGGVFERFLEFWTFVLCELFYLNVFSLQNFFHLNELFFVWRFLCLTFLLKLFLTLFWMFSDLFCLWTFLDVFSAFLSDFF